MPSATGRQQERQPADAEDDDGIDADADVDEYVGHNDDHHHD